MENDSVTLRKIGPIDLVEIPLPAGRITVLEGHNGAGKTTALRVLAGDTEKLTPKDGSLAGEAIGCGLEMTVASRVTTRGTLAFSRLSSLADPSVLVDPGFKSEEANDLRRVLTLTALVGIEPSIEMFLAGLGKPAGVDLRQVASLEAVTSKTVPEMAQSFKRDLEKASRAREQDAASLRARAGGLAAGMDGIGMDEPHDADALAAATEDAVRFKADVEARARAARDAAEQRRRALAQLEAAGASKSIDDLLRDVDAEEAAADRSRSADEEERAGLAKLIEQKTKTQVACSEEVIRLRAELTAAEARLKQAVDDMLTARAEAAKQAEQAIARRHHEEVRIKSARARVESARTQEGALAKLRELVSAPLPSEPTQDELASAELRLAQARKSQDRGAVVREARTRQAQAQEVLKQAEEAQAVATALRDASQAVWGVVEQAVEKVRPRGLRLVGGRVVYQHPVRGECYFSELSNGERWRIALDAAIDAVGDGGLVCIRQEAWEGLDPENRDALAAHVAARGARLVTAQASDGELRATLYQPNTPL